MTMNRALYYPIGDQFQSTSLVTLHDALVYANRRQKLLRKIKQ